jgi:hypothetical protein
MLAVQSPMPAPFFLDFDPAAHRKRTSSFAIAPPAKAPRTSLQRTPSYLDVSAHDHTGFYTRAPIAGPSTPRREHRVTRVPRSYPFDPTSTLTMPPSHSARIAHSILRKPAPSYPPPTAPLPAVPAPLAVATPRPAVPRAPAVPPPVPRRAATPAPPTFSNPCPKAFAKPRNPHACRRFLPPRGRYPKCRDEPSLYRTALLARMGGTPAGEQILRMGARMAVAMLEATQALEGLVAAQDGMDCDADADADVDAEGDDGDELDAPLTLALALAPTLSSPAPAPAPVPEPSPACAPSPEAVARACAMDECESPFGSPTSSPPASPEIPPAAAPLATSWIVVPQDDWEMVEQ